MELTIIGSGTGYPSKERGGPALMVRTGTGRLLFDCGAGTVRGLLAHETTVNDIDCIAITHLHPDHIADFVTFLFVARTFLGRERTLTILGPRGFGVFYEGLLALYGNDIAPERYRVVIKELSDGTFAGDSWVCSARPVAHTPNSLGYRIEADGRVLAYSGDTGYGEGILSLCRGADIAVLECSYPDEDDAPNHLCPAKIKRIVAESGCGRLILTHLYPSTHPAIIRQQLGKACADRIVIGHDGFTVRV